MLELRRDQEQTLFLVVEFANRRGRPPSAGELAGLTGVNESAARARISRLRRGGYLIGRGRDTAVNRTDLVTEPGTALALLQAEADCGKSPTMSLRKAEVLRIVKDLTGRSGPTAQILLEILIRTGYLEEVPPDRVSVRPGRWLANQHSYLEMLSKSLGTDDDPTSPKPF